MTLRDDRGLKELSVTVVRNNLEQMLKEAA